jgi:DNA (cytosine-5)-methyltransferase 1
LIGELGGEDSTVNPYFKKNMAKKPMTVRDYLGDSIGIEYYYRHPRNYSRRAIYSIDEPSPTIRGVNRPVPEGYKGHPADPTIKFDGLRPLTTIERSYIQTFPTTFAFDGSKSDLEQMIGNAVPVKLADFVANCIAEYINDASKANALTPQLRETQLSLFEF